MAGKPNKPKFYTRMAFDSNIPNDKNDDDISQIVLGAKEHLNKKLGFVTEMCMWKNVPPK